MSKRKLDEIENMFKQTAQPKLEIEEVSPPKSFGVLLDDTAQGRLALDIATQLSKKVNVPLDIVISEEYYEAFHMLIEGTQKEIEELKALAQQKIDELDIYAKFDLVIASKVEKAIELLSGEVPEEEKLGERLVTKLEELESDIVFLGVPIFRGREENEAENLGGYVTKLLRARRIHSNFMLITDDTKPGIREGIMSFVSIEQQPGSITAVLRQALSLSNENTEIEVVGMIEDKVIETVARVDQLGQEELDEDGQEILDLENATSRLKQKMDETLASIKINEDIPHKSFKYTVEHGSIAGIINAVLDEKDPGMVIVRSVAEISENLDPIAEQITRIVLRAGYPCLIVWD